MPEFAEVIRDDTLCRQYESPQQGKGNGGVCYRFPGAVPVFCKSLVGALPMFYSIKALPRQLFRNEAQVIALSLDLCGTWPQWRAFAACGLLGLAAVVAFTEALSSLP